MSPAPQESFCIGCFRYDPSRTLTLPGALNRVASRRGSLAGLVWMRPPFGLYGLRCYIGRLLYILSNELSFRIHLYSGVLVVLSYLAGFSSHMDYPFRQIANDPIMHALFGFNLICWTRHWNPTLTRIRIVRLCPLASPHAAISTNHIGGVAAP